MPAEEPAVGRVRERRRDRLPGTQRASGLAGSRGCRAASGLRNRNSVIVLRSGRPYRNPSRVYDPSSRTSSRSVSPHSSWISRRAASSTSSPSSTWPLGSDHVRARWRTTTTRPCGSTTTPPAASLRSMGAVCPDGAARHCTAAWSAAGGRSGTASRRRRSPTARSRRSPGAGTTPAPRGSAR